MPPAPIEPRTSYGPRRIPGASDMDWARAEPDYIGPTDGAPIPTARPCRPEVQCAPTFRKERPMHAIRPARLIVIAALLSAPALIAQVPSASDPPKYALPPKPIVDVFDAELLPGTISNPNHQSILLTKARAYPTIAEMSQPMLRLAGARINAKTNGAFRDSGQPGNGIYSLTLKKIEGGAEVAITVPPQAKISHVEFSPDGSRLAFLQTKETGIELWVADTATGAAKAVVSGADRIKATTGDTCVWLNYKV